MASSRKRRAAEATLRHTPQSAGSRLKKNVLVAQVADVLRRQLRRDAHLHVGLSGGIDSVILLHILAHGLRWPGSRLSAVHVNHQLSPHANRWAAFCARYCRRLGVPLQVVKVDVTRGNSTEAAARAARYGVFADSGADLMVLAHNRDDQAETVLLQLLRGAGPRGLAAMPECKAAVRSMPAVLRPLLDVPRESIAAYARTHRLRWVEDESNRDRNYLRNFLRHDVMPLLVKKVPGTVTTLARAARHQAEASALLDALAAQDLGEADGLERLSLEILAPLAPHRARNVLRYFLRCHDVAMPEADRLAEVLRQATTAQQDARVCVEMGGGIELRRFRNALHIVRALPRLEKTFELTWDGRGTLALPQLAGSLRLARRKGAGIAVSSLSQGLLTVRARRGSESLRLNINGRQRTVRNLLQEAALPPWVRERLPFLYIDGVLAAVPGLGVDVKFQPGGNTSGLLPVWTPDQVGFTGYFG